MCEITIFANVEMPTFLTRKVQLLKASNSAYPKCSLFQLEKRRSFLVSSGMFTFHLENAWICKGRCCNQRSGTICSPIRRNVARRLRQEQEGAPNSDFHKLQAVGALEPALATVPGLWKRLRVQKNGMPQTRPARESPALVELMKSTVSSSLLLLAQAPCIISTQRTAIRARTLVTAQVLQKRQFSHCKS